MSDVDEICPSYITKVISSGLLIWIAKCIVVLKYVNMIY